MGSSKNWFDGIIDISIASMKNAGESLKKEQKLDLNLMRFNLYFNSKIHGALRFFSRWLYGRAARKRIALLVLIKYLANLSTLGFLSILFWAFVIKYSTAPDYIETTAALYASASRVIPGIPDSTGVHVDAWIQAAISITAWMIFVLYAGPVSSLFPAIREQSIEQAENIYKRLRTARKRMHPFLEQMRKIVAILREHPVIQHFYKLVLIIKKQPDINRFLCEQPTLVDFLRKHPELVPTLKQLDIQIPDLSTFPVDSVEQQNDQLVRPALEADIAKASSEVSVEPLNLAEIEKHSDESQIIKVADDGQGTNT
jgi:hypothetical protein